MSNHEEFIQEIGSKNKLISIFPRGLVFENKPNSFRAGYLKLGLKRKPGFWTSYSLNKAFASQQ